MRFLTPKYLNKIVSKTVDEKVIEKPIMVDIIKKPVKNCNGSSNNRDMTISDIKGRTLRDMIII